MALLPTQEGTTLHAIERAVEASAVRDLRGHLGASQIGKVCERALWYGFRWVAMTRHEPRMLRLFARGQREEQVLIDLLRVAGIEVHDRDETTGEQFRVSAIGGHFGGSLDACAVGIPEAPEKWHVTEFKTHNDKSFQKLLKEGVEQSKPEHWAQMQMYMQLTGMERALYLAVNKNDDSLYVERVRYAATQADVLLAKANRIITSDRPPAKINENPAWYKCKFCGHHSVCHGTAVPIPTCRSCIHATAELDGDARWSCALNPERLRDLSKDEQLNGCTDHLFIPDLLANWATLEDASPDGVLYINKVNGNRFVNGLIGGYSSIELYRSVPAVVGDPIVDAVKKDLGGTLEHSHATV